MGENIELRIEPFWNITSEVWIGCSKCDFNFLVPLVAMIGKKPANLKIKETKKSLLGSMGQMLKPKKDSGERIFGFMWAYTKFCKKCKAVHILKLGKESIELKDKYWEELKNDEHADFVHYLDAHTKSFDIQKEERCECGGSLIVLSHSCPICNNKLKMSKNEVDGLPIMRCQQEIE